MANLSSGSSVGGIPILTLNDLISIQAGSVVDASTITKGIVQLADSLNIDSSSLALTAKQGKILNDEVVNIANTKANTSTQVIAGTGLTGGGTLAANRTISLIDIAAGSGTVGALAYNGTTRADGKLYGGTTDPNGTTRLNYNGAFHATKFTSTGDIVAHGSFTKSSDLRLKSDLKRIDDALDKVDLLSGYTYLKNGITVRESGVIAQELLEVLPEAVKLDSDGYYTVSYESIVPLIIEAIKELKKKIVN